MPILKRTNLPKRPKSLASIRDKASQKGKQLLQQRYNFALKDNIDLTTLVRLQRGRFGSGYFPTSKPFEESSEALRVSKRAIGNAATAISTFCGICQGAPGTKESKALVRDCEHLDCPLWAFRLGSNPFFDKK